MTGMKNHRLGQGKVDHMKGDPPRLEKIKISVTATLLHRQTMVYRLRLIEESRLSETDGARPAIADTSSDGSPPGCIAAADLRPTFQQVREVLVRLEAGLACRKSWNAMHDENMVIPPTYATGLQLTGNVENPPIGDPVLATEDHHPVVASLQHHPTVVDIAAADRTKEETADRGTAVVPPRRGHTENRDTATAILSSS